MAIRQYTDRELRALHERREQTFSVTLRGQRRHAILFEPYNISHTEYRVLALLFFSDGGEPSVIADKLMILRQTMTKVIDSLEAKGYVSAEQHPDDRRVKQIRLTERGEELCRRSWEKMKSRFAVMTDGLSPEECVQLDRLLDVVYRNIEAVE